MTSASLRHIETPTTPATAPAPLREPEGERQQAAAIATVDGSLITAGVAAIEGAGIDWRATLARLDRPGVMVSLYFGQGVREVVLRLEDGREARARIAGTSFVAASERVCQLVGLEPLA
ncbi:MAG TPA: hypothetical protein VJP07_09675 [Dehalococcoidia bacterium]|nr:hypothetical protein [Dehalococcoidia bacterium]